MATRAFTAAHEASGDAAGYIAADIALVHAVRGSIVQAREWLDVSRRYDLTGRWIEELVSLPADIAGMMVATDRLDQTADHLLGRLENDTGQSELWPFVVQALTDYALTFGEAATALTAIDRYSAQNPAVAEADGIGRRILRRCTADLCLALGNANRARLLIEGGGTVEAWLQPSWARLWLLNGDHARAFGIASDLIWDSATPRDQLDLAMTKAAAAHALGDLELAKQSFAQGAALAASLGALRPYLQIDVETRGSLLDLYGTALDDEARSRLDTARQSYPDRAELVTLTERELAVLYELTRSTSWSEIADVLVVAPGTAKKQLVSLYAKLGVHDREAALLRATRLGFLPEPGVGAARA